jgi:hypothetical protein
MKRVLHHIAGVLFDGVCLVAGGFGTFLAIWAGYEGTLEQFWSCRLVLSTFPLLLIALLSGFLREDPAWRCWLRFVLFEALAFLMVVDVRQLPLSLLVDATVYAAVLNGWRVRWRTVA